MLYFACLFKHRSTFFVSVLIFIFGFAIGHFTSTPASVTKIHPNNIHFKFINPLLGVEIFNTFQQYKPLKNSISNYIASATKNGKINTVSVYFRNLENGNWMGINEDAHFDPASLLKVPLMIAFLKYAERDRDILTRSVFLSPKYIAAGDEYQTLRPNRFYTVEELLRAMIVKSDNGAKNALLDNISRDFVIDVFNELNIEPPSDAPTNYKISTKTYAFFFRFLYNATILNWEMSEKALGLLNETIYKDGLVAGIPSDVQSAHKFGERYYTDGSTNLRELHDCGIVYATHPYLLCIMTSGTDSIVLKNVLKDIFKITYDTIEQ